ncbi:MAG TPA: universal stress protein [Methanomassiliicoccales archaeon]|nr:universal stress protein [Methanomassiliicoccales archaeon]
MRQIKKILAAVDGSKCSNEAAKFAAEIAMKYGSDLTILHVYVPPETTRELPAHPKPEQATQRLEESERMVRETGIAPKTLLEVGNPAIAILNESKNGYDLIVMGSRGLGAVEGFLLGSVTSRVAHHTTIPLLIVPPGQCV